MFTIYVMGLLRGLNEFVFAKCLELGVTLNKHNVYLLDKNND